MRPYKSLFYLCSLSVLPSAASFVAPSPTTRLSEKVGSLEATRREVFEFGVLTPAVLVLGASVEAAHASGGATAGGAYLLSAKQRYNDRVKGSIKGLLAAQSSLSGGDSKPAKAYFSEEDEGTWKDLTAAGYLLSNAFRRNSTAAPDR